MNSHRVGLGILLSISLLAVGVFGISASSAVVKPVPTADTQPVGVAAVRTTSNADQNTISMTTWDETRRISAVRR